MQFFSLAFRLAINSQVLLKQQNMQQQQQGKITPTVAAVAATVKLQIAPSGHRWRHCSSRTFYKLNLIRKSARLYII